MSDVEPTVGQTITEDKPKHAGGRPPKLTPVERQEVYDALVQYIRSEDDPTIAGFVSYNELALEYWVTDDNIYDWPEFSVLRKRAFKKCEAYLLKDGGSNKYNTALAIFRLKQPVHGYKDRTETDITSKGEQVGQSISPEQAEQLLRLRAKRAATD